MLEESTAFSNASRSVTLLQYALSCRIDFIEVFKDAFCCLFFK